MRSDLGLERSDPSALISVPSSRSIAQIIVLNMPNGQLAFIPYRQESNQREEKEEMTEKSTHPPRHLKLA